VNSWPMWVAVLHAAVTVILALPVLVLALELWAAVFVRPKTTPAAASDEASVGAPTTPRPSVAVLVPAHNEAAGIAATVAGVRAQLQDSDRVLVVADNCSDATAAAARAAGAEVSERFDTERRGKGYALAHGVAALAARPPAVVVILDADCHLGEHCIERLARASAAQQRPVQALDLMLAPHVDGQRAGLMQRVSEFAWRIKNHARARGTAVLRMPCPLMGTGMAFPWALIADAPLASGSIVEDMRLGAELTLRGHAPVFLEHALVTSEFPDGAAASDTQRKRWEHGHLGVIVGLAPRLLAQALTTGRLSLLVHALDLSVPPLALLTLTVLGWAAVSTVLGAVLGATAWVSLAVALALALLASVLMAWWVFGRDLLAAHELASVPWYIARKLPMYLAFLFKRETTWVRTQRRDKP
jgi:cellulose synthase/poly-beta-1,6-N-acetylglucosamine synthase-like glycosyltransferase